MKTFSALLVSIILMAGLALQSCGKCMGPFGKAKINCTNGGTCNDGVCDCLKGYFGQTCDSIDLCEMNDVYCDKGLCSKGVCECFPGYEGEDCTVSSRQKYFGKYVMVERCEQLDTITNKPLEIEWNPLEPTQMYIINLCNYNNFPLNGFFSKIYAVPNIGTNTFDIPHQKPDGDNTDKAIQGNGELVVLDENTTTLTISYTLMVGNKTYNCNVAATKLPEEE